MKDNFRFWMPAEIEKAVDEKTKKTKLYLAGFASSNRKDTDGENLEQNFDINYLVERGIVNWNHSKDPDHVIGEPAQVKFVKGNLWVKSMMYEDQPMAQKVMNLAEVFRKNSSKRKLGYSIEGKVLERDPNDASRVLKALITNIAVTVNPKNCDSLIDIVKGNYSGWDDDENLKPEVANIDEVLNKAVTEENYIVNVQRNDGTTVQVDGDFNVIVKSMDTEKGRPIIPASVNKKVTNVVAPVTDEDDEDDEEDEEDDEDGLTKAEVIQKILSSNSGISLTKANEIFEMLNKKTMSNKKTAITEDLLNKSLESLGIKSTETQEQQNAAEDGGEDDINKGEEGEEEVEEVEEVEDEGGGFVTREEFTKGIESLANLIRSAGVISKKSYDVSKSVEQSVIDLNKRFGVNVTARKAVTSVAGVRPVQRDFNKGVQGESFQNTQKPQVSVSQHRARVLEMMDKITFKGGAVNEGMSKAMTTFESTGNIYTEDVRKSIENEFGIELVR